MFCSRSFVGATYVANIYYRGELLPVRRHLHGTAARQVADAHAHTLAQVLVARDEQVEARLEVNAIANSEIYSESPWTSAFTNAKASTATPRPGFVGSITSSHVCERGRAPMSETKPGTGA